MLISVISPAYNKGKTIERTFKSLLAQTQYNFEWIVVNDGSTDNTDALMRSFKTDKFPIVYLKKENEGLSRTFNKAMELTSKDSDIIFRLDPDDYIKANAMTLVTQYYDKIKADKSLCGMVFLSVFADGRLVGTHPFKDEKISDFFEYREVYGALGDRAEIIKTNIYKEFGYPVYPGEKICVEGQMWTRMADKYKALYVPIPLYYREYNEQSLSSLGNKKYFRSPTGTCEGGGSLHTGNGKAALLQASPNYQNPASCSILSALGNVLETGDANRDSEENPIVGVHTSLSASPALASQGQVLYKPERQISKKLRLSVITPVYNRADCIKRNIDSVAENVASANGKYEVEQIIVDDGSKDDTAKIVSSLQKNNPHIRFIKFIENRGTNAARNAAIATATGDFCIILDSDDYFVDNALDIITQTIDDNPSYIHYMFAPDDMMSYYDSNNLLKDKQNVLTYEEFLSGAVTGDFVHVIKRDTLLRHPFDETLKIHEGVFFLLFYKDAGKMLFTKEMVTIRERNRADSVTRDSLMLSKIAIERNMKATEYRIDWFQSDYERLGLGNALACLYQNKIKCALMLSDYKEVASDIDSKYNNGGVRPMVYKAIYHLRLGRMSYIVYKTLVIIKYKVLKSRIK